MGELISRQDLLDKFEPWLKVKDYNDGELNMLKAILYEIRFMPPATDKNVGTKLGTDCISRQSAINAIDECYCGGEDSCGEPWIYKENAVEAINMIEPILSVEPKRETATASVGTSKGGVTMWYECEACGEPVDPGDTFCSGCGRELIHE